MFANGRRIDAVFNLIQNNMDAEAPKDVTLTCKHCGIHKIIKAHWKNSVIYSTCNACSREFRYELKNWRQVFKN